MSQLGQFVIGMLIWVAFVAVIYFVCVLPHYPKVIGP